MSTLEGRVALVTGGSRGIGAGIAQRLAADGATVAVTYNRSPGHAEEVVGDIAEEGGDAVALHVDAGDRAAVRAGVKTVAEQFGRLDILVNSAGVNLVAPIEDTPDDKYDEAVAVNLTGVYAATQEALRHLGDGGRIINIGSVAAQRIHYAGGTAYALTKAGVIGFTHALARELGPRRITVNAVQPGPIDTDMNPLSGDFAPFTQQFTSQDRYGTTRDIAGAVAYLASPEAGFVTGTTITVDGGYLS
ncbi:SDR family NAD(P)-dependent oxidoreductase [Dactylosporangium sp. CS-033363]|uniref:SDR family NAD(P)-dependent oxidoreductase n=1 Tax=Dactylosporangium sp. CS-033363 TaxID=3239935 RepID=UPI003D926577